MFGEARWSRGFYLHIVFLLFIFIHSFHYATIAYTYLTRSYFTALFSKFARKSVYFGFRVTTVR